MDRGIVGPRGASFLCCSGCLWGFEVLHVGTASRPLPSCGAARRFRPLFLGVHAPLQSGGRAPGSCTVL